MKIIDLYNKIANGEEVPKKIKYKNCIFENRCVIEYWCKKTETCLDELILMQNLNDEVEIIEEEPRDIEVCGSFFTKSEYDKLAHSEEEKKIPEKLDVLVEVMSSDKIGVLTNEIGETQRRLNQLIDYVNYLKSKGE